MGLFTLADQLKKQPKQVMTPPVLAPVEYQAPPPEQDISQHSPDVIPPANLRNMSVPGQGMSSEQPPLPQEYQQQQDALFKPGPLQQRYTQAAVNGPGDAPHGILGHLKGAGLGFLMGGVPGAIAGGISPGIPQRAVFRGLTLPQLAQQADQEMQQQGQQRQSYHALAQSTGYDPITHQPTLPMLTQQNMMLHRNILENQGQQRIGIQQQLADTGEQSLEWRKQFGEQRLAQHQQGLDNGSHQLVKGMTAQGKVAWFSVNKADPSDVVQVADADGKPLETPDAMLEGGRNARFAQGQAGINSRFQQGQNSTESRFQRSQAGQESRFQRSQQGMDRRAQSKRGGGLLDEVHRQHPELGGGQATSSAPKRTLTATDIKAYADANYKGDENKARQRIAKDHPDWVLP